MRRIISLALAFLIYSFVPVAAQDTFTVVQTCGTLPLAYLPGAVRSGTQDVNGRICGTTTISGGGTVTANQGTSAAIGDAWPAYLVDAAGKARGANVDASGNLNVILPAAQVIALNGANNVATSLAAVSSGLLPGQSVFGYVWNGTTFDLMVNGAGTASKAVRVELPTDGTGKVGLNAAETHIGEVGGNILPISVAPTTSNNSVTTGKSIGGALTFANAVRVSGSLGASGTSGIFQNLSLFFKDAVTVPNSIDLYLFNASPSSTCTDNTTFALSNSDLAKVIGIVHITDFTASNTGVIAQANNLAIAYGLASATSLFGCLVTRGTFAITSTTNLEVIASVVRN